MIPVHWVGDEGVCGSYRADNDLTAYGSSTEAYIKAWNNTHRYGRYDEGGG
jgi:hypothetical protein